VVNIASMRNNGKPTTESIVEYYTHKLNIKHIIFEEHERDLFAIASSVKDRQIATSKCDWIFNPDSDHVYAPGFFYKFLQDIKQNATCEMCIGSRERYITDVNATNAIVNDTYETYITDVYAKALEIQRMPPRRTMIGSHVAFRRDVFNNKCKGIYAERKYDWHLFNRGMGSKSDKRFRGRMGGTIRCFWPPFVHLNHTRDKEVGHHTEEQR
jgi:hypothetical protein